jgi:methionyl-tRNA formyltransferase
MIKFAFFGGGDFSVRVLEILKQNSFVPEFIITAPDKPKGRKMILTPPPIKIWAQKNNIKYIIDYSLLITDYYDLFIIAAYGKIIPKEILDIPKYGTLNVHPSLLPKYRGPSPIQSFILSGEKETGVTIMLTDEKMDHGPILANSKFQIPKSKINYKELEEELAELGGNLLVEIIQKWINDEIKPQEQDHSKATFTKKIIKEDGLIDIKNEPAEIIERKIRAFTPWPSAYFFVNGKRLIITKAELTDSGLKIERVKPEGKNEMNFEDFLRGYKGNPDYFITNGTKAKPG